MPDEDDDTVTIAVSQQASVPSTQPVNAPNVLVPGSLPKGTVIDGKYEIQSLLGKGGMCTVYEATEQSLDRTVALKMLHERLVKDNEALERFKREGVAVCALEHRNIIKVYRFGVVGNRTPYMAMEYLKGESLADLLKREKRLDKEQALPIFSQILDALAHAHTHGSGIIHRDLKPANVMLVGPEKQVKLVDFGIAKILPEPVSGKEMQKLTQTGDIFGTLFYMSPEQCEAKPLDARSDLYSMGCLMYEVLAGDVPLKGESQLVTMTKHLSEAPRITNFVAGSFGSVVLSALEKDPTKRPQTAKQLKYALSKAALEEEAPVSKAKKIKKSIARKWVIWGAALIVGLAVVGAIRSLPQQISTTQLDKEIAAIPAKNPDRIKEVLPQVAKLVENAAIKAQDRAPVFFCVRHLQNKVDALTPSFVRCNLQAKILKFYRDLKSSQAQLQARILEKTTIKSFDDFINNGLSTQPNYSELELACKQLLILCGNDPSQQDRRLATYCTLARVYFSQGKISESENSEKAALVLMQSDPKQSDPNYNPLSKVMVLDNFASFYLLAHRFKDAEKVLLKEWQICRTYATLQTKGWDSVFMSKVTASRLIQCYLSEGKKDKAAEMNEAILQITKE